MIKRIVAPTIISFVNFDIQTMIQQHNHPDWVEQYYLSFSFICQENHMVIPKYLLKTLAIEIKKSLYSNHISFTANHTVLIPLSILKQPLKGTKPFVWDRDATGISIAVIHQLTFNINNSNYSHFTYKKHTLIQKSAFGEADLPLLKYEQINVTSETISLNSSSFSLLKRAHNKFYLFCLKDGTNTHF